MATVFNPNKISAQAKDMLVHEIGRRKTGAHQTPKAQAAGKARENLLQFVMKNLQA